MTILTGFDLCRAAVAVEAISAPEQSVLMVLAIMADKQAQCWPSIAGLVSRTKLSERSVQNAVKALAEAGHLTRKERPGHGVVYTVHPRTVCAPTRCTPAGDAPRRRCGDPRRRCTQTAKNHQTYEGFAFFGTASGARHESPGGLLASARRHLLTAKAMADWPPGEIEEQVEHFIDLHTTKGTTSLDWQASWRTWVKNWKRFNGNRPRNHRNPDELQNPMVRALRNAEAREARQGSAVVQPRLLS
ncbi:hypothetical protein GCM10020258_46430 [Sphingomonas yabuuchiae]